MNMVMNLDHIDRHLLVLLQDESRVSPEHLASEVGASVATVQRRLKRLRASGVILREGAQLDPQALGYAMTFLVLVELERERAQDLDAFRRVVRDEPLVQQAYYVTGEADFALICLARDMADFEALTRRLFLERPNVRRFRTSVVMDRTKIGLDVPVGR